MPDDESTGGTGTAGGAPPYPVVAPGRRSSYGFRTAGRRSAAVPPEMLQDRPRRLAEYAMPAAVILAGVLIVVAFGFIVNRAVHRDDHRAAPLPQPPAVGLETPPAPSDQPIIPLPSPTASDSDSPAPPRTTPPPARTTPPDNGSIRMQRTGVAPLVDLSDEGSRDWVHWGEQSTFSLERDSDGGFAILEGSPTAPRFRHALSPQRFSWQDGSPVDHSDGTPTGIRTCGKGNGFTISAPAGRSTRTLRLYVGVLGGRGRLEAKLSTGGGTRTATLEQRDNSLETTAFVLTYRAPKDGRLDLVWVTDAAFNDDCGGVALEAATLR